MNAPVHKFSESLKLSNSQVDAPFWIETYRRAFPNLISAVSVRQDGWAQRGGVDRVLTLGCGRTVSIDEKVRVKDYGDILLERWSDVRRQSEGWIVKPLACDYIAYAIIPTSVCYFLPTLDLQRAWRHSGRKWMDNAKQSKPGYRMIDAENDGYTTRSYAVPINVLMASLVAALTIRWDSELPA